MLTFVWAAPSIGPQYPVPIVLKKENQNNGVKRKRYCRAIKIKRCLRFLNLMKVSKNWKVNILQSCTIEIYRVTMNKFKISRSKMLPSYLLWSSISFMMGPPSVWVDEETICGARREVWDSSSFMYRELDWLAKVFPILCFTIWVIIYNWKKEDKLNVQQKFQTNQ